MLPKKSVAFMMFEPILAIESQSVIYQVSFRFNKWVIEHILNKIGPLQAMLAQIF